MSNYPQLPVGTTANRRRLERFEESCKPESKTALTKQLGACVYFIRTPDNLIKIGFTTHLDDRKARFGNGPGWTHILAVIAGATMDDEHAHHERFAAHLARGREYFRPAPELIAYINEIRSRLGVSPVAA